MQAVQAAAPPPRRRWAFTRTGHVPAAGFRQMDGQAAPASMGKQWGVRSLRSGFGEQPTSNRASAPAAGFGSSLRDAYQKQYASAEVDRAQVRSQGNIDNPLGACYSIPVGRLPSGRPQGLRRSTSPGQRPRMP